ncbi:acetoin utilization protein AcuB [Desulfonatronum thiosulfatophilum]|uniref:Acetoin utilization protein AcuB n=1 Tax=Desulfonatronum thiosulfatophilum TaxID=617002 RepID=A0A1G6CAV4_9BACT|nr:CBS domain-containing protein [Desulfonatronum thiosulfatophilum]SDB30005.1 acetoin utilization protein AcuB [Desulfonatronum thiosulfatophilum]
MYVGLKMITDMPTITPATLVMEADKIMEKNRLWMLMAVDQQNRFLGAVRKEDVRAALPSPVTTLSRHELNYLMSKLSVEKLILKNIPSIPPQMEIEEAAKIMFDEDLAGLPVVDSKNNLLGYINRNVMLDVLVEEMGLAQGGSRIVFEVEERTGVIAEVSGLIADMRVSIISTATFYHNGKRMVVIRVQMDDPAPIIKALLERNYNIVGPCDFAKEWC